MTYPPVLFEYEPMWTTERDQWQLWRVSDGFVPVCKGEPLMALTIEDDDVLEHVIDQMLGAGVQVVDSGSPDITG